MMSCFVVDVFPLSRLDSQLVCKITMEGRTESARYLAPYRPSFVSQSRALSMSQIGLGCAERGLRSFRMNPKLAATSNAWLSRFDPYRYGVRTPESMPDNIVAQLSGPCAIMPNHSVFDAIDGLDSL